MLSLCTDWAPIEKRFDTVIHDGGFLQLAKSFIDPSRGLIWSRRLSAIVPLLKRRGICRSVNSCFLKSEKRRDTESESHLLFHWPGYSEQRRRGGMGSNNSGLFFFTICHFCFSSFISSIYSHRLSSNLLLSLQWSRLSRHPAPLPISPSPRSVPLPPSISFLDSTQFKTRRVQRINKAVI